jgi:hypothetical protein
MRKDHTAPLLWMPVWVWVFVGVLLLVLVLFYVLSVGRFHARSEWEELGIDPPVARHWGEDRNEEIIRFDLLVERDASIHRRGEVWQPEKLRAEAGRIADTARDPDDPSGGNPSRVVLNLLADSRCPWRGVREVLSACSDPDVRIYRIRWEVRDPEDEGDPVLLRELRFELPAGETGKPSIEVELVRTEGGDVEVNALLSPPVAQVDPELAEVRIDPDVPYGKVVQAVDRLIRDGVRVIRFTSP